MRDAFPRLSEMRRLLILDSAPEGDVDAITETLANTLEVPIGIFFAGGSNIPGRATAQ